METSGKMKEINYSVIIPHYNIPQLLIRCLESIPVREDIQVIVVDDCSPGADKYIEQYPALSRPYLEFYQTPIGGSAGRARNLGIENAKGRWLTFVDSDDFLAKNAEQIFDKYKDRDEDVLYFRSESVMSNDITKSSGRHCFQYHFNQYLSEGNELLLRYEFDAPWGKMIKKSLIDKYNIRFDEVRWSNDSFFSAVIGTYARTIYVPDEIFYYVTERPGSLTSEKVMSLSEWETRYHSALQVQHFFDMSGVVHKRYAFVEFLNVMWKRNKRIAIKELFKLSNKDKIRVLYSLLRSLK